MSEREKTCFIVQSFDGGKYDKRYKEIYKAAVEAANLRAIRADEVLGTRPIIETIEEHIASCDAVLADISENNENVFLELGYALAVNKPCVIICDKEARSTLPFDIRHRPVVFYDSHSPSSFTNLGQKITSNLKAEISKEKQVRMSNVKTTTGEVTVEGYENTVIGILLTQSHHEPEGVGVYAINREFERFDYTDTTLSVALESLKQKGLITPVDLYDDRAHEKYQGYRLSDEGMKYVLNKREVFAAKKPDISDTIDEEPPF